MVEYEGIETTTKQRFFITRLFLKKRKTMKLPAIDQEYFTKFLVDLLNIASPTGFAEPAIAFVEKELSQYKQLELSRTRKGALVAKWGV